MPDTQRPTTTDEEIERTGRDEQVTGKDASLDSNAGFGTPGTAAERVPPGLENDLA